MISLEKESIWQTVLLLPVKYREVILLFYRQELSTTEISQLLGMQESSVRTRLKRARQLLHKALEKEELDYEQSL